MKDEHIIDLLDGKAFAELSGDEREAIKTHSARCAGCEKAYAAARISSALLATRAETLAAAAPSPSPFFEAKVMNAIRARQQNLKRPIAAFRRWWQASFAPVCAMLLVVASLITLSLLAPPAGADEEAQAAAPNNLYTTDAVILNQRSSREMTNEQVFRVIYNPRYEANKK